MNLHSTASKAFLLWIVAVAVGLLTQMIWFGPPGSQLIQIALLGVPVVISIIYFLLRANRLGKNTAMVLAVLWFSAPAFLSSIMPAIDSRLVMLITLAIGVSLNLALTLVLRGKNNSENTQGTP
ncbi:MAG TPA: hypothetical protein VFH31_09250 [Pyrinomonadaceae bacterium]|nr:hypothetical protein [Pyrinomonadaceae bacterium]